MLPSGAQVLCSADADCPADTRCIAELGACAGEGTPCIEAGRGAADGTSCGGDRICVSARCVEPSCGDGLRSPGEECDPLVDSSCDPDTCTALFCGDGRVDFGEACDTPGPSCRGCVVLCAGATFDADGALANGCEAGVPDTFVDVAALAPKGEDAERLDAALIRDDDVLLYLRPRAVIGPGRLVRAPRDGAGVVDEVLADVEIGEIEEHGGGTYFSYSGAGDEVTRIARLDGDEPVDLGQVDQQASLAIAVDDDWIWSTEFLALGRLPREGGAFELFPASGTGCLGYRGLAVCGEHLLCVGADPADLDAPVTVKLVHRETGDVRVLAELAANLETSAGLPQVTCDDRARAVWRDPLALSRDEQEGAGPRTLALRPLGELSQMPLFASAEAVRWSDAFGNLPGTFVLDVATGAQHMIAGELSLFAVRDDEAVLWLDAPGVVYLVALPRPSF